MLSWKSLPEAFAAAQRSSKRALALLGTPNSSCAPNLPLVYVRLTSLDSPILGDSPKMIFTVFHDSVLHKKCLGRIEVNVSALLESQRQRPEEGESLFLLKKPFTDRGLGTSDIVLSLTDERGRPIGGRLTVRVVAVQSMSAAASATAQARAAEQKLSPPLVVNASEAVTSVTNTVSTQMDLVTSMGSLLAKVDVLVKLGDEVAKVCSQLSLYLYCPEPATDPSLC
jgi:hypothetical protein